jgi:hypothetical protein
MDSTWPQIVAGFILFLEKAGLAFEHREERPEFDNKLVQYQSYGIGVRIVSDRGTWHIEISDLAGLSGKWYDAGLFRDLLLGTRGGVIPFPDQIALVEENWPAILTRFSSEQRSDTHAELALLGEERVKRQFPQLCSQKKPAHVKPV